MSILKAVLMAGIVGAAGTVDLDATISVENLEMEPTDSTCSLTLGTTGGITYAANFSGPGDSTWGSGVTGAEYEARATVTVGSLTSGTAGSWLSLSSARTWSKTRTSDFGGTEFVTFTLEIRDALTQVVKDSSTVTLSATVEAGG